MSSVFFRIVLLLLLCCGVYHTSLAQTTIVTGRVYDPLTNENIPFANLLFTGTAIGQTTDLDGNYRLETSEKVDSLKASFVGYLPVTLPVVRGKKQEINFALRANKFDLAEVTIRAGENPALILLKKIMDNKPLNDRDRLKAFQYEVYNKLEFDINNITEKFKKKRLFRPFQFVFDNIDSTSTNQKPYLPVFLTETVSEVYFRREPVLRKEIIKASKVSGVENETVTQYLGDLYSNINIYDNYIYLFGKGFISPIAGLSQIYYKYMLMDSAYLENKWCYKITFHPRRKHELTFQGEIWVHDSTFAIRKLNIRMSHDANINFIEDLAIVQDYEFVNENQWMLAKEILVVNLAPTETKTLVTTGFVGRKTTFYRKFVLNEPREESFFKGSEIQLSSTGTKKDADYWDIARGESLTESERRIYSMIDTIKTIPAYKRYADVVKILATGYKNAGPVEIGPLFTFLSTNKVEGLRLRLGGQTSNQFSTRLVLSGYGAYGFKDERYKFGASARYFTSKQPRQFIGVEYKKDVEQLGKSPNAFSDDNFFASILRREASNKLNDVIQEKIFFEHEWVEGFSTRLTLAHSEFKPLGDLDFSYFINDARREPSPVINNSEASFYLRFAYKERFVSGEVDRISLGSRYPVLHLQYSRGLKDVINSGFTYDKARIKIEDNIYAGNFGIFYISAEAGKIWQSLPYPLLYIHPGNNSFVFDRAAFNLMNFYEFISDEYFSMRMEHHFGGVFLDRIPAIKKLRWREVASLGLVSGRLSAPNRALLADPRGISDLSSKPYMEAGVGIENIFKILRIDNVWRLSYLDRPDIAKVAILASISISF